MIREFGGTEDAFQLAMNGTEGATMTTRVSGTTWIRVLLNAAGVTACALLGAQRASAQVIVHVDPNPVYVQQPQYVIVTPAPPPPPPPVVIYRPAPPPPPVVYVQPAPVQPAQEPKPPVRPIVVRPPQVIRTPRVRQHRRYGSEVGLRAAFAGMVGPATAAGGTLALRLSPTESPFGFDIYIGGFGGSDEQSRDREEFVFGLDAMLFLSRGHLVQPYFLLGVGGDWAWLGKRSVDPKADFMHIGAQAGFGVQFFMGPRFALTTDLRVFLRTRVGGNGPEFVDVARGRSTDLSTGLYWTIGGAFYF